MTYKIFFTLFFVVLVSISIFSQGKSQTPEAGNTKLIKYVTDETGTLTNSEIDFLGTKLKRFRDSTSTQIVVYMINTLDGEPIEQVANDIATKNKIGRKGSDNGILLLIAKKDHKMRIEVGYGLEGMMTDALSSEIIRKEISPYFKNDKYYEGINNGIEAMVKVTKGEYHMSAVNREESTDYTMIPIMIFGGIAIFIIVIIILAVKFGNKQGYSGGYRSSNDSYSSSSYSSSSSDYSSSSSDSSSSSSDFSGDGGSFGGGGASGDW
jgi:uncharacterized protein